MTQKRYTEIPRRFKSIASDDPYVAGAEDIEAEEGKTQKQLNEETDERITTEVGRAEQAEGVLDGKVATEKQRAEGVEGGLNTRLQTVEQLASISVGGGDIGIGTAADFESDDPEDLAKVPTIGAMLGGANDGVYDISARHSGTKYADLAAALGTNGANVPVGVRRGGMSVKFVQTSDNKYYQFRLMANEWSIQPSDWQKEDTELLDEKVFLINEEIGLDINLNELPDYFGNLDSNCIWKQLTVSTHKYLPCNEGMKLVLTTNQNNQAIYAWMSEKEEAVLNSQSTAIIGERQFILSGSIELTVPANAKYLYILNTNSGNVYLPTITTSNIRAKANANELAIGADLYYTAETGGYIKNEEVVDINSVVSDTAFTKHSVTKVFKGQKFHIVGYSGNTPRAYIVTDKYYNRKSVASASSNINEILTISEDGYLIVNYDNRVHCSAKYHDTVMNNIIIATDGLDNDVYGHLQIPMAFGKYSNISKIGNVINLTPEPADDCKAACVDCIGGDTFIINTQGGNSPRAFAFLDNEQKVIYPSEASKTYTNEYIVAPEGAKYLLINDLSCSKVSYKKWSLQEQISYNRKRFELVINDTFGFPKFANYAPIDHSSIDIVTSAINGAHISQETMKTQILISSDTAKLAHDSRLVHFGNKLYCVFLENMVDTGDSATSVNAYVKIAIFNPSTMVKENEYIVAKNGDTVDGLTIISGAGVPNAVAISNGVRCFYGAQLSDNKWYVLYKDYIVASSTFDNSHKAKFVVNGDTLDFNSDTLNLVDSSFTNSMISMNSDIAFDSDTDTYYTGVLQYANSNTGIIVKTEDLVNFELWIKPNFNNESHAQFEGSCVVVGDYLYYALRQLSSYQKMIIAKFELSSKVKADEIVITDAGSRPNWIKTGNDLYLFHSINDRKRAELAQITPSLKNSGIAWNTQNRFVYPSVAIYDDKFYFTYSYGRVILSCFTSLYKYDVEAVTKKLLSIF